MTRSEAKRHLNLQKWSEPLVSCTFWLRNVLRATTVCTFSTSQLPKVVRSLCALYILTSKWASRHNGVHFFDISTSKSGPDLVCFVHFDFKMCFAPQRRTLFRHLNFQKWSGNGVLCAFSIENVLRATTAYTFSTSQLPKVVRTWCVLYILTSKCVSRHNGVHFFDISTSKSGPDLVCFIHFDFDMCFAPQRRATFYLSSGQLAPHPPLLRAYFSTLYTEPQNQEKTVFPDFPTFSRTCIFFLLIFSLLTLRPADCFFISPYCQKFDFQTSFGYWVGITIGRTLRSNALGNNQWFLPNSTNGTNSSKNHNQWLLPNSTNGTNSSQNHNQWLLTNSSKKTISDYYPIVPMEPIVLKNHNQCFLPNSTIGSNGFQNHHQWLLPKITNGTSSSKNHNQWFLPNSTNGTNSSKNHNQWFLPNSTNGTNSFRKTQSVITTQ